MNTSLRTPTLVSALVATALLAGFFYAFSAAVNLGLGDLDDRGYIAAMQSINDAIPNGVFVLSFVGAPLLLLAALAIHAAGRSRRVAPLALAAALVVAGGLVVTFAANVPLNDELARVDLNADAATLASARDDYEGAWNAWNAVRVVACTAAVACLGWALRRRPDEAAGAY